MLFDEWQAQRALLNHDILCNQLRNELGAVRMNPQCSAVVRLKMWPQRAGEYRKFFDMAAEALSPKQILDSPAFAAWEKTRKEVFRPIIHETFLVRTDMIARVQELHELLTRSIDGVEAFLRMKPAERTLEAVAELQELLDSLSKAISALPREIGRID